MYVISVTRSFNKSKQIAQLTYFIALYSVRSVGEISITALMNAAVIGMRSQFHNVFSTLIFKDGGGGSSGHFKIEKHE